jgi:hypothetical protein
MCNDYGLTENYESYLAAFSQIRIPVKWPTRSRTSNLVRTSGRPTKLPSFAASKMGQTNSPNSDGASRRLSRNAHP